MTDRAELNQDASESSRLAAERENGGSLLPAAALSRVVVLAGSLASIKLVLLIGLQTHLQQAHWRIHSQPVTLFSHFAFYGLVIVGVWTLIELSRHCQAIGVPAVRRVNAAVLGLGLLLILLTFREGDKNYFYPILTGVLPWSSLLWYLSMDCFFRPPFLAAWLVGYTASYYVMTRLQRERQVLLLTSAFASCYWVTGLRQFLERGDDLWVAASFGLLALFILRFCERGFHPGWLLAPPCWLLLTWALFSGGVKDLLHPAPYFMLLLCVIIASFAAATWLVWRAAAIRPWCMVMGFYVLAFLLLSNANYSMAANYTNLIKWAARFPHYFLGELSVAGAVAVMAILYLRIWPNGRLWWLDVLGCGLIGLTLVDLRLTQVMGVRLGWDVIEFGNSPIMMWRLARPYLPAFTAAVAAVCLTYGAVVFVAKRVPRIRFQRGNLRRVGIGWSSAVACFSLLAILGVVGSKADNAEGHTLSRLVKSSPLGRWASRQVMTPAEFRRTARELGMSGPIAGGAVTATPQRTNLNVVLIFQESVINKYCSLFGGVEDTQPLLAKYRDRMQVFPNFFSSFQGSIHARFATFTGLYPVSEFSLFTLNHVGVKSLFEVMHENGYACSLFYSSYADYTGFRSFLKHRGLDLLYDADSMPGERKTERVSWGLREEETLEAIRMQIRTQARSPELFFLTYVPATPHNPFDAIPPAFRKYKAGAVGDYTPFFLNEMLYMDWVISSIVDELKETGLLDRTLVVITSDHGEMLGDEGGLVGHGWRVTPELGNVPLILMHPHRLGFQINRTIGSQVVLLPTLLDLLGIPLPPDELYQGVSLYSAEANGPGPRLIYLNSYRDCAVVQGNLFWRVERRGESDADDESNGAAYNISNDGARTLFTMATNAPKPAVSIQHLDQFQRSLLQNYSFYRDALRRDYPSPNSK